MADLITDTWNGLRVLKVSNEAAEAVIALHGAHVLSYKPAGEREVLWLSQESWHEAGKPIRGGIPVCWPWFGPAKEPAHGVARITEWALKNTVSDTAKTVLAFEAFAFENLIAEITITIADSLTLELSTTNLGVPADFRAPFLFLHLRHRRYCNLRTRQSGISGYAHRNAPHSGGTDSFHCGNRPDL